MTVERTVLINQIDNLGMDEVWSVFDLARAATLFVVTVILVGAALTTMQTGGVSVLGDFIKLVVVAMLMIALLGWAWSWIEASGGR